MQSPSKFLFEIASPFESLSTGSLWIREMISMYPQSSIHFHIYRSFHSHQLTLETLHQQKRKWANSHHPHPLIWDPSCQEETCCIYTHTQTSNDSHGLNAEILFIVYNNISERAAENRYRYTGSYRQQNLFESQSDLLGLGNYCWGYILLERI